MTTQFGLTAQIRDVQGKGASRRLRHQNLVPAIIYGGSKQPISINLAFNEFIKALESEAFYSHILTLNVAGKKEKVVLKALQRHPVRNTPMHADFLRIDATHTITMRVPIHFTNQETCIGVKQQGGKLSIITNDVEVETLPDNLPEYLEYDLLDTELGTTVHLSNLALPKGVTIPVLALGQSHDQPIAMVTKPRGQTEDEDEVAADEGETSPASE